MAAIRIPTTSELQPPIETLLRALPMPTSRIVTGPPGSGKTVLAVHLAGIAAHDLPVDLVVASQHLVSRLKHVLRDHPNVRVMTWRSWLSTSYVDATGKSPPTRTDEGRRVHDWGAILQALRLAAPERRQAIVDEAQDIPPAVFEVLVSGYCAVLAFLDPYQRYAFEGTTTEDLVDTLASDHPWPVYVLEEDFRTTRQIQAFASAAWAPQRMALSRPSRNEGPLPRILRAGTAEVVAEARRLLSTHRIDIVVACAQTDRAEITLALERGEVPVARGPATANDGVRVLAFESLRGLEYEAVLLVPPSTWHHAPAELDAHLYVAATRARRELAVVIPSPQPAHLETAIDRARGTFEGVEA